MEDVVNSAAWVEQRIANIESLFDFKFNTDPSQSLEKKIRFLMLINTKNEGDAAADDIQVVESELIALLNKFQAQVVNQLTLLTSNTHDELKLAKLKNEISGFNVDFDLLFTSMETYFKQPPSYKENVELLFIEQYKHIEKLQNVSQDSSNLNHIDIDIEALKNKQKKIQFLTNQFYNYPAEHDQQSDSFIVLVDKLNNYFEQYIYLLDQHRSQINGIIEHNSTELSNELKQQGEHLTLLMVTGMILVMISLITFFAIAYQRLNTLRTTALAIAAGNTLPPLMKNHKSNDFVSTIISAFNSMIDSLDQRDQKIKQFVKELSNHGEKLEKEVHLRTKELSQKNRQLNDEIDLRKENEKQLELSGLALANTSEAIVITDAQRVIIEVNPAFCQLTGYSRTESMGQNLTFVLSDEHSDEFFLALWQNLDKEGKWDGEIINQHKSGALYPIWETINAVTDDEDEITYYVGVFRDISKLKEAEDELHNLAYYDHLTKLPNRSLFYEHLEHEIAVSKRNNDKVAVLFLDLDRFKYVNDSLGHQAGDQLLIEVSLRLKQLRRESDIIARQGGDEFLILLRGINNFDSVAYIASNIINELKVPFLIENTETHIGSSIGISMYPDDGDNVEQLIKNSDTAMYYAKENGKGNYQFYNESMNANNSKRLKLEQRLALAIENHSFELYFQPQINPKGGISGAEALLRWHDSELGMVPPDIFIPIAEDTGSIHLIGEQVIEMACKSAQQWQQDHLIMFTLSINLSPKELLKPDFVNNLKKILQRYNLKPQDIELEITETALLENIDKAKSVLTQLSQSGFTIALDDFGTGYSSLAYLHQLPIDRLKIDRSFISDIPTNQNSITVAKTIIGLAKSMDMKVVAEGVETHQQQDFLWQSGCDYCQGYGISKPLPEDSFIQFVQQLER